MTDLERLQAAFMKADALAQQGDAQAAQDARMFAQEIRRLQRAPQPAPQSSGGIRGAMEQVNTGIAETAGGIVDLVNPVDAYTGSAVTGIRDLMGAGGIVTTDAAPQTFVQGFMRGLGHAAGGAPFAGGAARALAMAPGLTGQVAGQVAGGLASKTGLAAEVAAGGISGAATETARELGAPGWAQGVAGVLAPLAMPLATGTVAAAGRAAERLPVTDGLIRGVRSLAPQSKAAAFDTAQARMKELAGGDERAAELARATEGQNPLGLTPAQQTGDQNMRGLERAAAETDPVLRERLAARETGSQAAFRAGMETEGNVADTKAFFDGRVKAARAKMQAAVDGAMKAASAAVRAARGVGRKETTNSRRVTEKIKASLDASLQEERALWGAVPKGAWVRTNAARTEAKRLYADLPQARKDDFPADAALLLDGRWGASQTVKEMHGLYSAMREVARNARSGDKTNSNQARVADGIADALLDDLGAIDARHAAGQAINAARAFSRALHETFDQGAVGRILTRTVDGDERIAPETALARTVGRGGAQAVADNKGIIAAAPESADEVKNYLRGRFLESIYDRSGKLDRAAANTFMRGNAELLAEYPEMRGEFLKAMGSISAAAAMEARQAARNAFLDTTQPVRFGKGQDEKAFLGIMAADDPARAARATVAHARRDKSGKALAGVKAAASDYLIGRGGLSGEKTAALFDDRQTVGALRQIFDGDELVRLRTLAREAAKLEAPVADVSGVVNAEPNRILSYVVRVAAAQAGSRHAAGSGMGGSLQAANIASRMASNVLERLTNAKARELLVKAVEDPELFRALLTSPGAFRQGTPAYSKLAPYLVGTGAAMATGEAAIDGRKWTGLTPFEAGKHQPRANKDGSVSTEITVTTEAPGGGYWNIPTLWWDKNGNSRELPPVAAQNLARRYEEETGRKFERFRSVEEAVFAAETRSRAGGAMTGKQ